jgi:hypothetical protein
MIINTANTRSKAHYSISASLWSEVSFPTNIMVHGRDIVSAIELAFYIPMTFAAIVTCFRHGFNRSSGWVFTLILCVVRIAGAVCQFLSRSNHSTNLITTTIIIDSIGLSPLLLATLGMLSRL